MAQMNRFPWKGMIVSYVLCTIMLFLYLLILRYEGNLSEDTKKLYGLTIVFYTVIYPPINSVVLCLLYYFGHKHIFKLKSIILELSLFLCFIYLLYVPGIIGKVLFKSLFYNDFYFLLAHAIILIIYITYIFITNYLRKDRNA